MSLALALALTLALKSDTGTCPWKPKACSSNTGNIMPYWATSTWRKRTYHTLGSIAVSKRANCGLDMQLFEAITRAPSTAPYTPYAEGGTLHGAWSGTGALSEQKLQNTVEPPPEGVPAVHVEDGAPATVPPIQRMHGVYMYIYVHRLYIAGTCQGLYACAL